MKNEKHNFNCESCPVKELLDKIWEPETKCVYYQEWFDGTDEEYETQHICGCCECTEMCDIPGHRNSGKYTSKKYCILDTLREYADKQHSEDNKASDEWPLPTYTGKYEDLFVY